jgi:glutamate N-acetyltransferase/amino-acid N-acetyltransferase
MALDAEGGTKVVRVIVSGAIDDASALAAARKVADANLVKCSWYGADPNWGRVVSELGTSGIAFDPDLVEVAYGEFTVCRVGVAAVHDEAALGVYSKGVEIELRCSLGLGSGSGEIVSADLTHGYIDENMGLS